MSFSAEPWAWESTQDILDYLGFAGFPTTKDHLARLHRRRLISPPFHEQGSGPAGLPPYPAGTAERMLRFSQLRGGTKQLDELAWRLWWEGFDVEPDLIRTFLLKKAARWDEQHREIRKVSAFSKVDDVKGERDVLEEVFFEHLKNGPAIVSARKRLSRGSELYSEFASLLIDLLRGDLSFMDDSSVGLFEYSSAQLFSNREGARELRRAGLTALDAMRSGMDTPFSVVMGLLDDKEIANARPVASRLLGLVANVGSIVQGVFGGVGHGRDNVGKSLVSMSESTEEQVISLLLTSSFMKDERVREGLPVFLPWTTSRAPISFSDFQRLCYLAVEVPGIAPALAPDMIREAFASPEGAVRWRENFNELWFNHFFEIQEVMALRPDLFEESPLEEPKVEEKQLIQKKKLNCGPGAANAGAP